MSLTPSAPTEHAHTTQPIAVTHSSMPSLDEFVAEIAPLWDSRWLTNRGAKHRELEAALNDYLDVERTVLFANGHLALEALIDAFELTGEVITTPFTFASTTHALVRRGLTPVFADIDPDDYTLDPASIESMITESTSAIMPVHVYGSLCDVDAIQRIADEHGLKVIYDAAHAFGVTRDGVGVGSFGDASMFSFHATKVFHTIEGGGATMKDPEIATRLRALQNFGIAGPDSVPHVGGNAKMNEFAAAMGLCNLRHIDEEIAARARVTERYRERLGGLDGIHLVAPQQNTVPNHAYFPVRVDDEVFGVNRDGVFDLLADHHVHARKYFAPLTSDFECYDGVFDSSLTPIARRVSTQILALPMYSTLSGEDVDRICDVISSAAA